MNAAVLREQQRALVDAIVAGRQRSDLFAPNGRGGPALIDAYQIAYVVRLTGALRDNFEVLARAMGDEAFDALAAAYIATHPSRQPSIRWFGHRLAEFMAAQGDADSPLVPHPALVDFARMDWALRDAFDGADATPIGREALAGIAPQQFARLRWVPLPSMKLVQLDWAIESAWAALRASLDDDSRPEPELPAPEHAPHTLLVWRPALTTLWRSLDAAEAEALRGVAAGKDFAALCEHAGRPERAAGWLAQWLSEGLLCGLAGESDG